MRTKERWRGKQPRQFGGKKYKLVQGYASKAAAHLHKEEMQRKGYLVRLEVVKRRFLGTQYYLWARRK